MSAIRETSSQAFEDQIKNHKAQITELVKHKTADHKDFYTVHLTCDKGVKQVFKEIGQLLLFQSLQHAGQLEEYASSIFGSDLSSFLRNGYMIKEYHLAADGISYSVTVHHVNASHILPDVPEEELAKCLSVAEESVKLKNVFHLGFTDAIEQGFKVASYRKHTGNENFAVQVMKGKKIKSFGNISRAHLALSLSQAEDSLVEEFGEHLQATEVTKRSASYSPNTRKMTLESAMSAGATLISSHPHDTDANLFTATVKTPEGATHVFPTVTRKHLDAFQPTPAVLAEEE